MAKVEEAFVYWTDTSPHHMTTHTDREGPRVVRVESAGEEKIIGKSSPPVDTSFNRKRGVCFGFGLVAGIGGIFVTVGR